jgi:hypothetical protein
MPVGEGTEIGSGEREQPVEASEWNPSLHQAISYKTVTAFCDYGQVGIVAVKAACHHRLPPRKEKGLDSGGHCHLPQSVGYPGVKLRHQNLEHSVLARVHAPT